MPDSVRMTMLDIHNSYRSSLARGLEHDGLGGNAPKVGAGQKPIYNEQLWSRPGVQIGHYTQMAWETSYKLGCSVEHCSSMTYVVCQYGPTGNAPNYPIYTVGDPCKNDRGCPNDYKCSVSEGLCVVPEKRS
ncbi:SCP-like protein [Oesophagostomum dentatum]|uniref:SCP-like protein n=1 Tax=Oesophagostomum dentatum TaxID=61180 RepID=A0A0B1SPL5_OESDE|nr:SCP-like protein [Oesophagostomum dentatum]